MGKGDYMWPRMVIEGPRWVSSSLGGCGGLEMCVKGFIWMWTDLI